MFKVLINKIKKFNKDRDWEQFHTGENLAKSISIEANELLELFQWSNQPKSIEGLKEEIADIFIYSLMFSEKYGFDIENIILEKLEVNEKKYPVKKSQGKSNKYNDL